MFHLRAQETCLTFEIGEPGIIQEAIKRLFVLGEIRIFLLKILFLLKGVVVTQPYFSTVDEPGSIVSSIASCWPQVHF